ncbi:MAG: CgeB family protein [Acidobacteriota bacterium]
MQGFPAFKTSGLPASSTYKLIIVGGSGGTNIGDSLLRGAGSLHLTARLIDASAAYRAPWPVARVNWWLRDHRPSRLRSFGKGVVEECRRFTPTTLLAIGLAPLTREALDEIGGLGIHTISYLTDDPWNPSSRSRWFFDALPGYGRVFSPRQANLSDLRRHGCARVGYLPFGVDPDLFYPEALSEDDRRRYQSDVFFAGGADPERVPFVAALIQAGLDVALHGDYWGRFADTRAANRGHATPEVVRKGMQAAKLCLCLVRRANRDGLSMRSFEIPAVGGCMLAEDTAEHRALFGSDGEAVGYFQGPTDMVDTARRLIADPRQRARMAQAAHRLVSSQQSTYRDRLRTMLETEPTSTSTTLQEH